MQLISVLVVIVYLTAIIVLANQADSKRTGGRRKLALAYPYQMEETPRVTVVENDTPSAQSSTLLVMQVGILGMLMLFGGSTLLGAIAPPEGAPAEVADVSLGAAVTATAIGLFAVAICSAVLFSRPVRVWMSARLGNHGTFNPDSSVHSTAFFLAIVILSYTLMEITLLGGVEGLAEDLQEQTPGALDAVANLFVMMLAAFLGVGLIVRRNWAQVAQRLSLRIPTVDDIVWGMATAFGCLTLIFFFSIALTLIFSPEALEQQGAASQEIARALGGSLYIAFLAAFAAAVGEEILFRGAVQPVFGLIPTTLFFGLLHSQYAFTPGSAVILIVGGAFGVLKQRQSTTAAIIAHFIYNFVLLGLAYLFIQLEESGLLPEITEGAFLIASFILPI